MEWNGYRLEPSLQRPAGDRHVDKPNDGKLGNADWPHQVQQKEFGLRGLDFRSELVATSLHFINENLKWKRRRWGWEWIRPGLTFDHLVSLIGPEHVLGSMIRRKC